MNRDLEWFSADQMQRTAYRARNALGGVTLTLPNDAGPVQTHQTLGYLGELRSGVLRLQNPGFTSVPLVGAKGIAVYPGGNRVQGIIVGVEDVRYRPVGLNPGEFLLYAIRGAGSDGTGGTAHPILKGTVDGNGELTGIEINVGDANTTNVAIVGSAQVSMTSGGSLTINGATGDVVVNGISLVNHTHPTPSGESSPPTG
jgi:phage baseplate assembly protein V